MTRNPHGNRVAAEPTATAGRRLGCTATVSYVELDPLVLDAVREPATSAVVVPLLLSTGHHVRHDLPAQAGPDARDRCSAPPDPAAIRAFGSAGRVPHLA